MEFVLNFADMTIIEAGSGIGVVERQAECPFTKRELEALQCHANGMRSQCVATALGVTVKGAFYFRRQIAKRVCEQSVSSGVHKAIIMAVANGWIKTNE